MSDKEKALVAALALYLWAKRGGGKRTYYLQSVPTQAEWDTAPRAIQRDWMQRYLYDMVDRLPLVPAVGHDKNTLKEQINRMLTLTMGPEQ